MHIKTPTYINTTALFNEITAPTRLKPEKIIWICILSENIVVDDFAS